MLVDGWLRTYGPPKPVQASAPSSDSAAGGAMSPRTRADRGPPLRRPPQLRRGAGRHIVAAPTPAAVPATFRRAVCVCRSTATDIESFKGGFAETRGSDRPHEAVDMLAPRNTPVHAVENGTIAKLFTSKAGGITIYQFDPGGRLCYYYAHLERYADGLKDGQAVSQGDVIGYVGTTGNAPANTPHLHFAVFELNADKHWWQGRAIDPYLVFKDRG